jgi:hypothetical protein
MNLQLNDPGLPAPGELQEGGAGPHHGTVSPQPLTRSPLLAARDPHHNRTPSLGELHQELEAEQEAQVNRLLQMIRQQQLELQRLQAGQQGSSAAEDTTPTSERSSSIHIGTGMPHSAGPAQHSTSTPRSPVLSHPRSSFDMTRPAELRNPSRTPSRQTSSPRMRAGSMSGESAEPWLLGGRDESAFYQAETQSLMRENQMLRHRIRELGMTRFVFFHSSFGAWNTWVNVGMPANISVERQLTDAHAASTVTREPVQHSQLTHTQSVSDEKSSQGEQTISSSEAPKED